MRFRVALALVLLAALAGCTRTRIEAAPPGQITVVATTTQMQDLVRNVGGRRVHVVGILQPNVDPHDFEPTPSAAVALAGARLVVESGAGADAWADRLVAAAAPGTPVFVAATGLPIRPGDAADPQGDPHWWFDPTLYERAATELARRLAAADPGHARGYRANAARYVAVLRRMDAANRRLIARVPPAQRTLVTTHDAFGYLAAHYGIRLVGAVIPSQSTAAAPSANAVADLIRRIRAEHVRTVFTESSLNPALAEQIAAETGARVTADLYGDSLGPPGSPGATYLRMERWDVRALVAGFLGAPPPRSS
jgi:zinc/manganese transport system substrate-binding protein